MDIQHFDSITVIDCGRFFAGVIIGYGLKKGGECYYWIGSGEPKYGNTEDKS
jgi:hypothetical protein